MIREKEIETARLRYKPNNIKTLLIAEAPPDNLERFFYYENVKEKDYLFLGITEALYPDLKEDFIKNGRTSAMKSIILNMLKKDGFYLIDLSDTPISLLNNISVESFIPNLLEKLKKEVNVNTKIILIKASVYDSVYKELAKLGYKVINKRIPFPSSGQQKNFQRSFAEALILTKY